MLDPHDKELRSILYISERTPGHPSLGTIRNWLRHGFNGIRLDGARVGKRYLTSQASMVAFLNATTAAAMDDGDPEHGGTA